MRLFNWVKEFEENRTITNIPAKVRSVETRYWIGVIVGLGLLWAGLFILFVSPNGNVYSSKMQLLGLFFAIDGLITIFTVKICAHIRLAQFWILWDSQNRMQNEMNKMSSTDL